LSFPGTFGRIPGRMWPGPRDPKAGIEAQTPDKPSADDKLPAMTRIQASSRALAVAISVAVVVALLATQFSKHVIAGPARRASVAVLYFDYGGKNEELQALRKGLAQMMITDLAEVSEITVVERTRLNDVLDELKLDRSAKIDPATASRVGKL